jgi:glycosyltransferase involved in cell wall biosynthesis
MSRGEGSGEHWPALSVGMPVYNGARWLEAAAASMLGQTFDNIELIISDNASTDETPELAERLLARDPRVRYVRNAENRGAVFNYNQAASLARAPLFKWASVSDWCDATMLEKCVRRLEGRTDAVLCAPRTWLVSADGSLRAYEHDVETEEASPCARFKRVLQTTRLNNMMNGVLRTDAVRRVRPHGSYMASDLPFMAELALGGKFLLEPERLFYRRDEAFESRAERLRLHQAERQSYFAPRRRTPLLFQQWKLLFGFCAAARHAAIPRAERRCVYGYLLKCTYWSRHELWDDLAVGVTTPLRRARLSGLE